MDFLQMLNQKALLLDGAMGTFLQQSGVLRHGECPELFNLTRPLDILDVHIAYLQAGADIIKTNTFGANSLRLRQFQLEGQMAELIQSAAALAREAIATQHKRAYVAASIGPTGALLQHDSRHLREVYQAYFDQCSALSAAGVDLLLIETMIDLQEARIALLAAHDACRLPVLCSFTLEADEHTYAGNPPEVLSLCMAKLGASMVGVNCGNGPVELFSGFSRLAGSSPISTFASPNAGNPVWEQEIPHYAITPGQMREAMLPFLLSGASMIGGCCGTTPEHIAAMRELIDENQGYSHKGAQTDEYICCATKRVSIAKMDAKQTVSCAHTSLEGAADAIRDACQADCIVNVDLATLSGEQTYELLHSVIPDLANTPCIFTVQSAQQAHAALFIYPGIAGVYAQGDAYRVAKVAARYGAELLA